METLKQFAERMNKKTAEQKRKNCAITIYGTVGTELESVSTADLAKWFAEQVSESALRYYLEQQIAGAVINEIKYNS